MQNTHINLQIETRTQQSPKYQNAKTSQPKRQNISMGPIQPNTKHQISTLKSDQ